MTILRRIFFVAFVIMVLLFIGLSVYIQNNGKSMIEQKLSSAFQKDVHVGKARVIFPLGIRFDGVEIKDALSAKVLRINLGIPFYLGHHFNIVKLRLKDPVFTFTYSNDRRIIWGQFEEPLAEKSESVDSDVSESHGLSTSPSPVGGVIIDYLEVSNGVVRVIDHPHQSDYEIGEIHLKAMDLSVPPRDVNIKFDFSAELTGDNAPFAGQKAQARGMVNFVALNMDATGKVLDPDGKSSFTANFKSNNNHMVIKGTINVGRFVSGINAKGTKESVLEEFLTTALESSGVEIGVNFTCETKMDDFNCDKKELSGQVVQIPAKP